MESSQTPFNGQTMLVTSELSKLLSDIPRGAWVALSHDESRVVAYSQELKDAIRIANSRGEPDPVVTRVPAVNCTFLL
jgi:hypothetical protein